MLKKFLFKSWSQKFKTALSVLKTVAMTVIFLVAFIVICTYLMPAMGVPVIKSYIIGVIIAALSIIATLYLHKPLMLLMPHAHTDEQQRERDLIRLETENNDLKSAIETMRQTQQFMPLYNTERNLQVLRISKTGYIVKEEKLEHLRANPYYADNFPKDRFFSLENPNNWWVFYTNNNVYEYTVGINLNQIQYAEDTSHGIVYFKNVKLARLDRVTNDYGKLDMNANNAEHTWIVEKDNNGNYEIINNSNHNEFKRRYNLLQENMTGNIIQDEIDRLCEHYTKGLQSILSARYGNRICFVDDTQVIENVKWKSLSEGIPTGSYITIFLNDLYLTFDTMEICANNNRVLDKALLSEQSSETIALIEQ